jgi:hypothetical protein
MTLLIALLFALAVDGTPTVNGQQPTVNFSIRGDRARGWPAKTRIVLAAPSVKPLEWTLEAADARKPVALKVAPGRYTLTIDAPNHRPYSRKIEVDKDLSLPEIALAPVPAISGRVVERRKDVEIPLAGAQIMHGDKKLTATNDQGLFRVELSAEPTPAAITVVHTGQAPKTIPLFENLAAENDLGTIELDRGVTLTVHLDRRYTEPKTLNVSIWNRKTIENREVKPDENDVAFSGLVPGVYLIVIKGTEPLEAMNEKVEVRTVDLETRIKIDPFTLDGRVIVGNAPLRESGTIEIAGRAWSAEVPIDEEGRFGGTMWQVGTVTGLLQTPLSPQPLLETSPELGPGPSTWSIVLKRRFIEGHILDAATKEPLPKATLEVEVVINRERRLSTTISIGKDGGYSIPAMQNGRYNLRVAEADHAELRRTVVMEELTNSRVLDLELEGGVEAVAFFVWPDNDPVVDAVVVTPDGKLTRTDASGRATFRLSPGETLTVAAVPREGSFGIADLIAPRKGAADAVRVVVAPPAGSLRITAREWRFPLLLRYNGRMLPSAAVARLVGEIPTGAVLRLRRLPAGAYDVGMVSALTNRVTITAGEEAVELRGFGR